MKTISVILCVFWMVFIFYMSSNNGEISHQKSTKVADFVENTKEKLQNKINKNPIENNPSAVNKTEKENQLDYIIRKNAHAFMYMVLSILIANSFFSYNKKGKDAIVYVLFICLFYAVTDEFHQAFVPGRTSYVSDVLIDFGGALLGLAAFYLAYYNLIPKRYLINEKRFNR
ncbi:VanZ family protein [Clostridium sp.]|uniref:VanZ family protein n=1 Tax=Clostridium sp. TaxID=1506 RepID=UPI002615FCBD|nr:VanZ family protein [Clostridium sp.]